VIFIAGAGGRTPGAQFTIGGSVNAALLSFTKALADLGIRDGVQVNAINPGSIRTARYTARLNNLRRLRMRLTVRLLCRSARHAVSPRPEVIQACRIPRRANTPRIDGVHLHAIANPKSASALVNDNSAAFTDPPIVN